MDKSNQTQIATDFDRLIVDVAACDDLDVIKYYGKMFDFLKGLADMRAVSLKSAGYGVFLGDRFMKRFDTKDQAHEYITAKIVAIHECDEGEIFWTDYHGEGYCRSYRIGEGFPYYSKDLAAIWSVDEDDKQLHFLRIQETPPKTPAWLDYQTQDEAVKNLAHLVKENASLKEAQHDFLRKCKGAWEAVNMAKAFSLPGSDAYKKIVEWLKENKNLLQR